LLTVRGLLSSSECLGVTVPETVALRRLVERVDQWTERATAALADDSVARIHELIAIHRENPADNDSKNPLPTCQPDPLFPVQTSPDIGIARHIFQSVL